MGGRIWFAAGAAGAAWVWLRRRRVMHLPGRCAIVTGGSRGLGLALAEALAREGAHVALLARDETELRTAQALIRERLTKAKGAPDVDTLVCDLGDATQIHRTVDQVAARFGRIDILINNAGIIQVGPQEHMHIGDFQDAMAVHFWAPLHMMRAVIPHMRRQGGGRIVNISSVGGKVAVPHLLPYAASKFALTGLSDGMRAELRRERILVTTVAPGLMRTGSHPNVQVKGQHARELVWFAAGAGAPLLSMRAERAARRIVRACRHGRPALDLGMPAKLLIRADALAPSTVGRAMAWTANLLPKPDSGTGDEAHSGWESRSRWVPSLLTRRADREIETHNQQRSHAAREPSGDGWAQRRGGR